uniref:Reverse transcriptase domain-containing protein n=2 Tax=Tanacetum cinerariifolium TaxID=118510 RepID=A0A699KF06_TANCI|nr:reverse transcriptase domain-containing protein [Tanacetum cinerariifolium]
MAAEGNGDLPNSCKFHGLSGDDANKHLDKFLHVTQSIKVNGVIDDAHRLYFFPYSLTHHATTWIDRILRNSINTFEQMAKMFLEKYFPPSIVTKLINEITNFCQRPDESLFEAWERYKLSIDRCPNHNMLPVTQEIPSITFMKMNTASSSSSGTLPGNTITNPKEDLKGFTTRKGTTYQGPTIPTTSFSLHLNESTILNSEPIVAPIIELVASPVSAPKPPSIPYPSRLHDQKLRDKANDQREKFFQLFQDLNFNISFADSLILTPNLAPVLLKKFPKKLRDPDMFLIPCDFPGMIECLAMADLGASINLMPLSVWNKLSLPELTLTLMTLELADRSISRPIDVAKDVYVKVGKFHFLADFVVVDFDADPRVPLILRRSFLKTRRAFIDVFEGELTLHAGKEAITLNLDQTSRYSANYNDMTANQIDIIDMACEE